MKELRSVYRPLVPAPETSLTGLAVGVVIGAGDGRHGTHLGHAVTDLAGIIFKHFHPLLRNPHRSKHLPEVGVSIVGGATADDVRSRSQHHVHHDFYMGSIDAVGLVVAPIGEDEGHRAHGHSLSRQVLRLFDDEVESLRTAKEQRRLLGRTVGVPRERVHLAGVLEGRLDLVVEEHGLDTHFTRRTFQGFDEAVVAVDDGLSVA